MINLLPAELREERQYARRNRVLTSFVVALATTAGLVAVVMLGSLQFFGADESALRSEIQDNGLTISSLRSSTKDLNETVTRLETVNQLYESGLLFSVLIPDIGAALPEGAILNGLSLTDGSTDALVLDVDLEQPEIAATLVRNLVESDIFEAADIGTIGPKGGDGDQYRYGTTITTSFTGAAETKAKAAAALKAKAAAAAELEAEGSQ